MALQVLGVICIALAIIGGMMYPVNTMSAFEIIAYVLTVSAGISGVLFLLYRRGFGEEP
jgi:ABC-type multidrug transport system permease subunit